MLGHQLSQNLILGPHLLLQKLDALLLLFHLAVGALLRLKGRCAVLEQLLLPAVEHRRSEAQFFTQVRDWHFVHVQAFARQLTDFMQVEILNRQGQFTFFRRLLNYDDWRVAGKPQSTQFLDYQVVNSDIEAERDHLRVGEPLPGRLLWLPAGEVSKSVPYSIITWESRAISYARRTAFTALSRSLALAFTT